MKIEVIAEDIAQGERHSPTTCPIANALHRLFPNAGDFRVLSATIVSWRSEETCDLPEIARTFIKEYDMGYDHTAESHNTDDMEGWGHTPDCQLRTFEPFSFEVECDLAAILQ